MGSSMAKNLLSHQVEVSVYNRSYEKSEALIEFGARACKTVAECVQNKDIVFTMLSNPQVVEILAASSGGILEAMKEGAIWVDCSTVNPSFTMKMDALAQSRHIKYIEAPVAGTKPQAEQAELVFFAGGDESVLKVVTPFMEMMGKKVIHVGEIGKGSSLKLLVNGMLAQSAVVFFEAMLLGESLGLSRDFLLDFLPNTAVAPPFMKMKASLIKEDQLETQFPLELMQKDLHLVSLTAYEQQQPMYLANLSKELYAHAIKKGLGREDFCAIYKWLEEV